MKLALLGPIAWRTPPRHYGPWELVTGLLADGLAQRGVDVTLFATLDSITLARLDGVCARPVRGGRRDRRARVGGAPRRARARPLGRVRPRSTTTSTGCRWRSQGCAQAPMVTTVHGFSSPQILPAYRRSRKRLRLDLRRRSQAGARLRRHRPSRRRHDDCCRSPPRRGGARVLRPHPSRQGHRAGDRDRSRAPNGRSCCAARCRTSATSPRRFEPHVDGRPRALPRIRRPGGSRRGPGLGKSACCIRSRSRSRSGSLSWSRCCAAPRSSPTRAGRCPSSSRMA